VCDVNPVFLAREPGFDSFRPLIGILH
jgi:hypothetical protein